MPCDDGGGDEVCLHRSEGPSVNRREGGWPAYDTGVRMNLLTVIPRLQTGLV